MGSSRHPPVPPPHFRRVKTSTRALRVLSLIRHQTPPFYSIKLGSFLSYSSAVVMVNYTEADIENALQDILDGKSFKAASRAHGVPRTTLRERALGAQPAHTAHKNQQRLSTTQEEALIIWILR